MYVGLRRCCRALLDYGVYVHLKTFFAALRVLYFMYPAKYPPPRNPLAGSSRATLQNIVALDDDFPRSICMYVHRSHADQSKLFLPWKCGETSPRCSSDAFHIKGALPSVENVVLAATPGVS